MHIRSPRVCTRGYDNMRQLVRGEASLESHSFTSARRARIFSKRRITSRARQEAGMSSEFQYSHPLPHGRGSFASKLFGCGFAAL